MTNTTTRIVLFLSSYAPLFLILAAREWSSNVAIAAALIVVTGVSLALLLGFLRTSRTREPETVRVSTVSSLAGDSMSYLFTYLFPFLDLQLNDPNNAIAAALFFGTIAVIYVRSNMIYINPVLSVLDYHMFRVQTEYGTEAALLTKRAHVPGNSNLIAVRLGDYVLMEKSE